MNHNKNNKPKPRIMSDEFKLYVDELNLKIAAATEAMKEVNRLKKMANLPSIIQSDDVSYDFDLTVDPDKDISSEDDGEDVYVKLEEMFDMIKVGDLEKEISAAGWSTSSSYC